jgi:hypothetical protein
VRATVVVGHRAGILESLGTALDLVVTAGTVCLADPHCLGPGHPTLATATDAQGQFSLLVPKGSDAAQPGTDEVLVALPGQVGLRTSFHVDDDATQDVALQPVQAWQPDFRFRVTGSTALATWTPLPGAGTPRLVVSDRYGREHVVTLKPGEPLDAHLLPPGRDEISLSLDTRTATYRTRTTRVRITEQAVSRSARCSVVTSRGAVRRTTEYDGCRLTDGDWSQSGIDSIFVCGDTFATPDCLGRGWAVRVDLGRVRMVTDVVVVGPFGTTTVESSPDGRRWQTLASMSAGAGTVVSTGPQPRSAARYLRITGDDLSQLTEIAAFA